VPSHKNDRLGEYLKGSFTYLIVLPLIVGYLRLIVGMMEEKEKKIKEGMKIMGLTNFSLYVSWIIW